MAVDMSSTERLFDVTNVVPTTIFDSSGNAEPGVTLTFSVAGIADQTMEFAMKGLTIQHVIAAIEQRVYTLVQLLDIEGPEVALDADGKPIVPTAPPW